MSRRLNSRLSIVLVVFTIFVLLGAVRPAQALFPGVQPIINIYDAIRDTIKKSGSILYRNIAGRLINQVAYDAATHLASGNWGKGPLYEDRDWWAFTRDTIDNASGAFIEQLVIDNQDTQKQSWVLNEATGQYEQKVTDPASVAKFIKDYHVCSPDITLGLKISLGLGGGYGSEGSGLNPTSCNLRDMYKSAKEQGQDLFANIVRSGRAPDQDYWKNLGFLSFDPGATDIGIAYNIFGKQMETASLQKEAAVNGRLESKGWLDLRRLIDKKALGTPGSSEETQQTATDLQEQNFGQITGDILVDAGTLFINQLALTGFQKLMSTLTQDVGSNSSAYSYFGQGASGGVPAAVSRRAGTLLKAQFNEQADYDILAKLTVCPDESHPGPTDCVITQEFSRAITNNMTVGQAIAEDGPLDGGKRLGFDERGNDISYKNGYPYRSLIILRKYRILPVGWEVAAQYIKDNPSATKDIKLQDLINCFDPSDSYGPLEGPEQHANDWCRGLIDPNWVLKIPKQYCGMLGYGPQITQTVVASSGIGYCTNTASDCYGAARKSDADSCKTNNVICSVDDDCAGFAGYNKCNTTVGKEVQVTRDNNYCADEQSCIKENPNGSCAYYGYCTEEKRRWTFNQNQANSCEPRNNTCANFQAEDGREVSYLQNTLDYSGCNPNQVGCKQYALTASSYNVTAQTVQWNPALNQAFFNKNIIPCDAGSEGCHQFIRAKDDFGTNLIADGSFEQSVCDTSQINQSDTFLPIPKSTAKNMFAPEASAQSADSCNLTSLTTSGLLPAPNNRWYIRVASGTVKAGIVNSQANFETNSLYIEGNGGLYSTDSGTASILPAGFRFETDSYYTLTATVYVVAGKVKAGFGNVTGQSAESTAINQWQPLIIQAYNSSAAPLQEFFIQGMDASAKFYIDGIQLTKGRAGNTYNEYLSNNVIYQKLLPQYLEATCYKGTRGGGENEFQLKDDAPDICKQFVRKCSASEVGCENYTSVSSGIGVTAKVKAKDVCPQSCVGYDTFVQQPNQFNARQAAYFIPESAQSCSAQAVGCTAFTNLDKLSQGGEAVEYYSAMRTCIKPDVSKCGQFYTWEGSDESGYQLKVFSLQKNQNSTSEEPASTMNASKESQICNATVFKKLPSEAGYNYDCREFYAQDGTISYHLYQNTISCSEDCHPYRREVASQDTCEASGGTWDEQGRCIYNAIPGEGSVCAAQEVGCQEYTGNIANNTSDVFPISTFEGTNNALEGWNGSISNTALNLGGHSMQGTIFSKTVGNKVRQNLSYTISFLAKAAAGTPALSSLELRNANNQAAAFSSGTVTIGSEWRLYSFNLSQLDHAVDATQENLRIVFTSSVFIDNIKLTEVPDRYYLIKDSWTTPVECDQDITGASSPRYMLGCSQYQKGDSTNANLRSFSELCQDSAAGCEAMIDTQNSSNTANKKLVGDSNNNGLCEAGEIGCFTVGADAMINVVYDRTKQCNSEQKACQRVGVGRSYDGSTYYSDTYIKNDPDQYDRTVCGVAALGCSKWSTDGNGDVYFKDPGDQFCEWRQGKGTTIFNWYKKTVKRCGGVASGAVCTNNNQCASGSSCTLYDHDDLCPVSYDKTLGEGDSKVRVTQPATWAGTCERAQSGCTEYVDPLSSFNPNLVRNPEYTISTSNTTQADFWVARSDVNGGQAAQQITLTPYTTYILKGNTRCAGTTCTEVDDVYISSCQLVNNSTGTPTIYQLSETDNTYRPLLEAGGEPRRYSDSISGSDRSLEFYVSAPAGVSNVTCTVWRKNKTVNKTVLIRKAIVSYQLEQNLDKSPILTSLNKGQVMFNERSQNGSAKAGLLFNADETGDGGIDGVSPKNSASPKNANVIIKVQPDRVCSKWLDCRSYVADPNDPTKQKCLDIGLCDSLNSQGKCDNFIGSTTKYNQNIQNLGGDGSQLLNLSGYSKVGYKRTANGKLELASTLGDYYNLGNMKQIGETVEVKNGGFEFANNEDWISNNLSIFIQPQQIQSQGLTPFHTTKNTDTGLDSALPPAGRGLAKLVSASSAATAIQKSANELTLQAGRRYVISAHIYNKSGEAQINLKYTGNPGALTLIKTTNDPKDRWLTKTAVFTAPVGSAYLLELAIPVGGESYFDDIKIESGLNFRCSDSSAASGDCSDVNSLMAPSTCRLYPTADALSCEQTGEDSIKYTGTKGYCLEYDPKQSDSCLLWYPLDSIASDQQEEGAGLNLPEHMYYCLETQGICSAVSVNTNKFSAYGSPFENVAIAAYSETADGELFFNRPSGGGGPDRPSYRCQKIVEVNNEKYWRTRFIDSTYTISNKAAKTIFFVSSQGGTFNTKFDLSNWYGAFTNFVTSTPVDFDRNSNGNAGTPFINQNDDKVCRGYVSVKDDHGDDCSQRHFDLGEWDTCACSSANDSNAGWPFGFCNPYDGNNCTKGEFACGLNSAGDACRVVKEGNVWKATTTDQERSGGDTHYSISRFNCSSPASFTYTGTKASDPKNELLSSLFVQSRGAYSYSNGQYVDNPSGALSMPNQACAYADKKCSGDASKSCSTDSDCVGKGTCFMKRPGTYAYPNDYCYIPPKAYGFTVDGATDVRTTNGAQQITFAFSTKTDPDQLPLRKMYIDLGYNVSASSPANKIISFTDGSYNDGSRYIRTNLVYNEIVDANINLCAGPNGTVSGVDCGATACCVIKPKVIIEDNWGMCNEAGCTNSNVGLKYNSYIRVDAN